MCLIVALLVFSSVASIFSLCNSKRLKVTGDKSDILASSERQFTKYSSLALQVDLCVEQSNWQSSSPSSRYDGVIVAIP